jgi:hypothetical protein
MRKKHRKQEFQWKKLREPLKLFYDLKVFLIISECGWSWSDSYCDNWKYHRWDPQKDAETENSYQNLWRSQISANPAVNNHFIPDQNISIKINCAWNFLKRNVENMKRLVLRVCVLLITVYIILAWRNVLGFESVRKNDKRLSDFFIVLLWVWMLFRCFSATDFRFVSFWICFGLVMARWRVEKAGVNEKGRKKWRKKWMDKLTEWMLADKFFKETSSLLELRNYFWPHNIKNLNFWRYWDLKA